MIKHTHKGKLMILKMVIENWGHHEGHKYSEGDDIGKLYLSDYDRVCYMIDTLEDRGKNSMNKDEMVEMNFLFKKYGGTRKTSFPWTA